jgi:hypothetical protein
MTIVDQFESIFRGAAKTVFARQEIALKKILVVTDLPPNETAAYGERIQKFLGSAPGATTAEFVTVAGVQYRSTGDLLQLVEKAAPDLICSYRNLNSDGWKWPHSLGESLDLLTQIASSPVMVVPHPKAGREADHALQNTNRVMAVTDHVSGDDRLVNWALAMVEPGGHLYLTHVEDQVVFDRYMDAISKIPSIDTDGARESIRERLLKDAHDYVGSVAQELQREDLEVEVHESVSMGHRLIDYRKLVDRHEVDLLVLNTRDEDQLAMHGLAYPIAVEMRDISLLML